jgi:hypothetical protein
MGRRIGMFAIVLGCAVALHAQDTTTTTRTEAKSDVAKSVTYSGCVQSGAEPRSFVLAKGVPVSQAKTTEVGTSGTTTTVTTTYALVPAEKIELQPEVGHKVEVTGIMLPAGDIKTETTTMADNAMPQFRVLSIKKVADTCS